MNDDDFRALENWVHDPTFDTYTNIVTSCWVSATGSLLEVVNRILIHERECRG